MYIKLETFQKKQKSEPSKPLNRTKSSEDDSGIDKRPFVEESEIRQRRPQKEQKKSAAEHVAGEEEKGEWVVAVNKKNKRRLHEESVEGDEDNFIQQEHAKASSLEVIKTSICLLVEIYGDICRAHRK